MRSSQRFSTLTRCLLPACSWLVWWPASATGQAVEHLPPLHDQVSQQIGRALTQRRSLTTLLAHGLPNADHPIRCSLAASLSRVRMTNRCALEGEDTPPRPQCLQIAVEYSCKNL